MQTRRILSRMMLALSCSTKLTARTSGYQPFTAPRSDGCLQKNTSTYENGLTDVQEDLSLGSARCQKLARRLPAGAIHSWTERISVEIAKLGKRITCGQRKSRRMPAVKSAGIGPTRRSTRMVSPRGCANKLWRRNSKAAVTLEGATVR